MSFNVVCIFTPTQLVFDWKRRRKLYKTQGHHISFDAEFYADFKFLVKILIPPTHIEITAFFKICVGVSQKFLYYWIWNQISNRLICMMHILWVIWVIYDHLSKKWVIAYNSRMSDVIGPGNHQKWNQWSIWSFLDVFEAILASIRKFM